MKALALSHALDTVRATTPLIHCITNYVTVNDCANALLACGGSPIMADEPDDAREITAICGGLTINIGTLNARTIESMHAAGARAGELSHPIVLDPVGAGASTLRTNTASSLLDELPIAVARGNMSEIKALAGAASSTRGVDVSPVDVVTEENLNESVEFVCDLAKESNTIVAVTGAIDIVTDGTTAYAVRNGTPLMGKITGSGCMLSCMVAAYVTANPDAMLDATVAAVAGMGLAGQQAQSRMGQLDGNGSFRTYLLDAIYRMDGEMLEQGARVEQVR